MDVEGQDQFLQKVVYDWKPSRCAICLQFYHSEANCGLAIKNGKMVDGGSLYPPPDDGCASSSNSLASGLKSC